MAFVGLRGLLQSARSAEVVCWPRLHLLRRLLCNLERVSVSCAGTAALWHGWDWLGRTMSPNLQYQPRGQDTPLCRACGDAMCKAAGGGVLDTLSHMLP